MRGTDSGQQLQHPKSRDVVPGVLGPAQDAQYVLHMGRFEELETAVLHEWDVALAELDFEQIGVVGGPHQHRLLMQQHTRFALFEHALADVVGLRLLVLCRNQEWLLLGSALRKEALPDYGVRAIEDRL